MSSSVRDLSVGEIRIDRMRRIRLGALMAGVVFVAWSGVAGGAATAGRSGSLLVPTQGRGECEPGGGLGACGRYPAAWRHRARRNARAGHGCDFRVGRVSISLPRARVDNAESCTRHGSAVACIQGEEACPMPAANWHFRVRKLEGRRAGSESTSLSAQSAPSDCREATWLRSVACRWRCKGRCAHIHVPCR